MKSKGNENNFVRIIGTIEENLEFSYESHGKIFYETKVTVSRKFSETKDHIPIIVSSKISEKIKLEKGSIVNIRGELRKYKIPGSLHAQTGVFVFEIDIINQIKETINEIILEGKIVEKPYCKETEGRLFTTLVLDVPRRYGKTDFLTTYAVDEEAKEAQKLNVGESIRIKGRVQSRDVPKKGMIFYEVFIKKFIW